MDIRGVGMAASLSPALMPSDNSHEMPDELNEIIWRQLKEEVAAYSYDLEYCRSQLMQRDLSPPEKRTLELRTLDLGHRIRHCNHRIELHEFHRRTHSTSTNVKRASTTGADLPSRKRVKVNPAKTDTSKASLSAPQLSPPMREQLQTPPQDADATSPELPPANNALQRLGFWHCRLCTSTKYLEAGPGRQPSAPCKWPLKDIGKLISHHLVLHTEHTTEERCQELGEALESNLGPFEYWLSRTKGQHLGDSAIEECIGELKEGQLPGVLRRLSKSASGFPS